jgi:hypothetical protein
MDITPLPQKCLEVLLLDVIERDLCVARRTTLIRILLHERFLTRDHLILRVESLLGKGCFGNMAWEDNFFRDMRVVKAAMKAAGYRVVYSRSLTRPGYFLHGQPSVSPELSEILRQSGLEVDSAQLKILRNMTPADRFRLGCSITDTARNAVAFRLRQSHPGMSLSEASYIASKGRLPF